MATGTPPCPSLAIAICTYDRAELLEGLIRSLCGSTCAADRVVVINNGPGEDSRNIVETSGGAIGAEYLRLSVPGLSAARNAAVAALDTDYILFLDDDVRLPSGYIAALYRAINTNLPDLIGGPIRAIHTRPPPRWLPEEYVSRIKAADSGWLVEGGVSGGNFAVRRAVFESVGLFNPRLGMHGPRLGLLEEYEFALRYRMKVAPAKIYYCVDCEVGHLTPPSKRRFAYLTRRQAQAHWQKGVLFRSIAARPRALAIAALAHCATAFRPRAPQRPYSRAFVRWWLSLAGNAAFLAAILTPTSERADRHPPNMSKSTSAGSNGDGSAEALAADPGAVHERTMPPGTTIRELLSLQLRYPRLVCTMPARRTPRLKKLALRVFDLAVLK